MVGFFSASAATAFTTSSADFTALSLIWTMRSPALMPARSAGDPATTSATSDCCGCGVSPIASNVFSLLADSLGSEASASVCCDTRPCGSATVSSASRCSTVDSPTARSTALHESDASPFTAVTRSPSCRPAAAANPCGAPRIGGASGLPITNMAQKAMTVKAILNAGPASAMPMRFHALAPLYSPGMPSTSSGRSASRASRNFT